MSDYNQVILLGRVGNDLVLKKSASGTAYVRFSLATNLFRSNQEKKTSWHHIVAFGTQAELCCQYLKKGSQVMVEGSLEEQIYTKDGHKQRSQSILLNRIRFLGGHLKSEVKTEDLGLSTREDFVPRFKEPALELNATS